MKKILILITSVAISFGAIAQQPEGASLPFQEQGSAE